MKAKPTAGTVKVSKGIPSSRMEGQLWKLIVDFDKSLHRVNQSSKNISSKDPEFSKQLLANMEKLRTQISSLCDDINNLDESRDQIEKDVLFVIGSDGDVHEQLEYGREILNSFNDEALKRTLDEQPLDQRSKETWDSLKDKLNEVHNPSKTGSVIEKALTTYKGREEDLFTRLFTMYVPDSTPEDVKKYLNGGPVPPKSDSATVASKSPAPANTTAAKSPFGAFGAAQKDTTAKPSPFGASPSAFSLGPAANTSSGFGGFGTTAASTTTTSSTTTSSLFGKPAVDYRQKLVEFYQKHNPDKLSSVDATLQKYKGNEEKLFQNLAVKYKVNDASVGFSIPPASPAVQPVKPNATASPFGKPGAFSAPANATAGGFGAAASGVNYREKLTAFYQQHNPTKLSSVDATLEKYKGREDHLFSMLEQKYVKKTTTAPATGGFGIPSTTTFGGSTGFGTPSTLG
ncbi:Nuclear pore complex protein, partial [Phytophthora palmivora]